MALAQLGDEAGAVREMQRIARRAPGSADMRVALAALYWGRGQVSFRLHVRIEDLGCLKGWKGTAGAFSASVDCSTLLGPSGALRFLSLAELLKRWRS